MYHSITFGTKNTWTDWRLIPTSNPVFNPPAVKSKYLDIPGFDGEIDISTLLTGRIVYGNRKGIIEFVVESYPVSWVATYSAIANHLHGVHMQASLEDDPGYYYEGRFGINEWLSEKSFSKIVIDYNVRPFKIAKVGGGKSL